MMSVKLPDLKNRIILGFIFVFSSVHAQEYSVEKIPNRFLLSWESVSMVGEPDLGFIGMGYDLFKLSKKHTKLYFGLRSYSAVKGIRPGLITLGMASGWRTEIFKKNTYLDFGGFIGAGGGGGAADGGGLILRPHITLEKELNQVIFRLGVSQINFPSGEIRGSQINFGIALRGANYLKIEDTNALLLSDKIIKTNKLRVALAGTQYAYFGKGSVSSSLAAEKRKASLMGIQIERDIGSKLYGVLKLNGAFKGGIDGYMSILFGLGKRFPLITNKLHMEGSFLFGPSGGGGIESGGGAITQVEMGIKLDLPNNYDVKLMAGKTKALSGPFRVNHFEMSLGKSFEKLFPDNLDIKQNKFNVHSSNFNENHLAFSVFNRTYLPPNRLRKDGDVYQSYFNLLGFEINKYLTKSISISGGTVWAYQGDYGAYAEGLLGLTYYHTISKNCKLTFRGMFGAGGGGDIDLGSGLLFQYSVGFEKKLNQQWDFYIQGGKTQPIKGNFTPFSIDSGFKFHIYQLLKKS